MKIPINTFPCAPLGLSALRAACLVGCAFITVGAMSVRADLADGLVGYWSFDGNLEDSSESDPPANGVGKIWEGTHADAPEDLADFELADPNYVDGKFGQSVKFADSFYVETPLELEDRFDFGALATQGLADEDDPDEEDPNVKGFTVSAWVTVDQFSKSWQCAVAKGESNQWRLHRRGDAMTMTGNGGSGDTPDGDRPDDGEPQTVLEPEDGLWYHIVLRSDRENDNHSFWVNGFKDAEAEGITPEGNIMPMMIGQNPDTGDRTWEGNIDDVATWNRPLTDDEIVELWNGGDGTSVETALDPSDPNVAGSKSKSIGPLLISTDDTEFEFTIRNTGDTMPLEVSGFVLSGANVDNFTVVESPTTIAPDSVGVVKMTFNANESLGEYFASLDFTTNDPDADDQAITVALKAFVPNPVGPIAHFKLDETGGTEIADATGNGNEASYDGSVTLGGAGLAAGTSVAFVGGGQLETSSGFPLDDYSIVLHFRANALGDLGNSELLTIVGQGEATPDTALLLASGDLHWFGDPDNPTILFSTEGAPVEVGTVYHVAMIYDGATSTGRIILDGVEVASGDVPQAPSDGRFYAGAFNSALGFNGSLDDIQFYGRVLDLETELPLLIGNPGRVLDPFLTGKDPDSDSDGLTDKEEAVLGTDPTKPDTDGDGLSDFAENRDTLTDPLNEDTDGDRFKDGLEIERGTDPLVFDGGPGGKVTIVILGTGTESLLGGDLTDPENDGLDEAGAGMDPSWNWVAITGNIEDDFGDPEAAFNIFDNQVGGGGAKWCCDDPSPDNPYWVSVEFAEAISLTHFTVTNGNDSPDRDPTNWQIQGSNDGENFETIFAEEVESIWTETRNEVALVTLASPSTPYKHIRYIVFDTPGALHQLNEIEYFGNVATSLLVNGSFEEPVLDNINTNNLGTVPTGWSQTGDDATWNLIRNDGSAYGSGVDNAADGSQIIDLNGIFEMFQNFTLAADSNVTFGASFANREGHDGSDPSTVGIYDAAGTNLLSPVVSVDTSAEPIPSEVWLSGQASVTLPAGDYQLRIALNNFNNVDAVFATATPPGGSTLGNGLIAYYPLDGDFDDNVGDAHGAEQG
ncbi:MAG: hypothetical protein ACI957_003732, partial [Verrucomicrobiales bacterium]